MTTIERLEAIEAIRQAKARYFRGVDTDDPDLVRPILAEACVLDFRGCFTDPVSGRDFFPAGNALLRGRAAWGTGNMKKAGITSVHQGYDFDIELTSDTSARSICGMTDRLFMPPGAEFSVIVGYGHYHETYERIAGTWQITSLRLPRLKVEGR